MRSPRQPSLKTVISGQRRTLVASGCLDFTDQNVTGLTEMGIQPHLRRLVVVRTPLTTLESLRDHPKMEELCADSSKLETFRSLARFDRIKAFSADSTPLATRPHFRTECILVFGWRLKKVNGDSITADERSRAEQFPPIVRRLLDAGWAIPDEVPDTGGYRDAAASLHLTTTPADFRSTARRKSLLSTAEVGESVEESDAALITAITDALSIAGIAPAGSGDVREELVEIVSELADVVREIAGFEATS